VSSHATCGGPSGSFASRTRVAFTVPTEQAGAWEIQVRPDYGLGGAVFFDGLPVGFNRDDMWEGLGQIFLFPVTVSPRPHVLEAYGIENCCDGPTFGLYLPPGGTFQSFATLSSCPSDLKGRARWPGDENPELKYTLVVRLNESFEVGRIKAN